MSKGGQTKVPIVVGGVGDVQPATPEVQKLCNEVKAEIETKEGKKFSTFKAISFKYQSVRGGKYYVKVHVGHDEYLHVCINEGLKGYQSGKTKTDEILK
ncbi:cystatin-A-like [Mixophyes fleayi]|uniref:cystatin-A-like n=1 Tax=Mixophyes fleayi TaxID=3061075 RepID=UPI003F4D872B